MPEQLRDIKDVIYVFDWGNFFFTILIFLILLAVGYLLFKFFKKNQQNGKNKSKEELVSQKPCNEIALESLMKIDPVEYFEKGKVKEYYFEITDVVRQFLSANYHIDTFDKTSAEIVQEMERVERDLSKVRNLNRYFSDCDLVKYARLRPELAEMKKKKAESENIIREYWKKV